MLEFVYQSIISQFKSDLDSDSQSNTSSKRLNEKPTTQTIAASVQSSLQTLDEIDENEFQSTPKSGLTSSKTMGHLSSLTRGDIFDAVLGDNLETLHGLSLQSEGSLEKSFGKKSEQTTNSNATLAASSTKSLKSAVISHEDLASFSKSHEFKHVHGNLKSAYSNSERNLKPSSSGTLSTITRQRFPSAHEVHQPDINSIPSLGKPVSLEDLIIIRKMASGGFAQVFLVKQKVSSGRYFALKAVLKRDVVKSKLQKQIIDEKNILASLDHHFIVDLYSTFQNHSHLFFVMEYISGGDLYTTLRQKERLGENDARFYVAEMIVVFDYLHQRQIIYRDLKPENILLDPTGHIRLADFGFAKKVSYKTRSFCGTPDYMAPEIVLGRDYDKSVDWWGIGVLTFELISGKTPFRASTVKKIYDNVIQGDIQWTDHFNANSRDFISSLLAYDPRRRLGASIRDARDVKKHLWLVSIDWDLVENWGLKPPILPPSITPEFVEQNSSPSVQSEVLDGLLLENMIARRDRFDTANDFFNSF